MKKICKLLFVFVFVCILLSSFSSTALAYYNRGKVNISIGSNNVTVSKGSSTTVTIQINPASRTGIQGCGDPGCPQICGGICGDEVNGECRCANDFKITKTATASVQSSNSVIARASYSNGVVSITGLNVGTTQVKVTASLWQYTDSAPQVINVTVTGSKSTEASTPAPKPTNPSNPAPEANTSVNPTPSPTVPRAAIPSSNNNSDTKTTNSSNSSNGTSSSNPNSGIVAVTPVSPNTSTADTKNSSNAVAVVVPDSNSTPPPPTNQTPDQVSNDSSNSSTEVQEDMTINGHKGTIEIISFGTGKTGKDELEKIKGLDKKITFQKKDSNDNVLYSWSYNGKDIKNPKDIDMSISFPSVSGKEATASNNLINPLFITFAHSGELPGKANIYINASSQYKNGNILSLYYYNKTTKKLELVEKNIKVSGGYISFNITHCSEYFLATGMKKSSNMPWAIMVIIIIAIASAVGFFLIKKRTSKTDL